MMTRISYGLLVRRILAAASVIAMLFGGMVYVYEMEMVDIAVRDLAVEQAQRFASLNGDALITAAMPEALPPSPPAAGHQPVTPQTAPAPPQSGPDSAFDSSVFASRDSSFPLPLRPSGLPETAAFPESGPLGPLPESGPSKPLPESGPLGPLPESGPSGLGPAPGDTLGERLRSFLVEHGRSMDGHFIFAELYTGERKSLAEVSIGDIEDVEASFDRQTHPFPADGATHYDRLELRDRLYLRVLTNLDAADHDAAGQEVRDGRTFAGFFEGIFEVAPERLTRIHDSLTRTVVTVIAVVVGTTLFLLPVFVSINRHLLALSGRLLHANLETLEILGRAIAKRDSDTGQHNYRVTLYAVRLAEALGLGHDQVRSLIKGAFLHDVGKIAISDAILLKPGKLDAAEFAIMKTHVRHGTDIVADSAWLNDAAAVVGGHHEKFDGTGYPDGLRGEMIPIGARVFAVVDVFDALTSRRPYKAELSLAAALEIMSEGRGSHFDPCILDAFFTIAEEVHSRYRVMDDAELRKHTHAVTNGYYYAM